MQLALPEIRAAGGEVIVVSKDSPAELAQLAKDESLGFRLLSDSELKLTDAFGLRHAGADVMRGGDLPRPTVLFFDGHGHLADTFATDNWRYRLHSEEALARVRALKE